MVLEILTMFWGKEYLDMFLNTMMPSLQYNDNIPEIKKHYDIIHNIYCLQNEEIYLQDYIKNCGYEVNINSTSPSEVNWSAVGFVITNKTDISLNKNETSFGKNWISVYSNTSLIKASDLLNNISNSDAITKWDSSLQRSYGLIPSPFAGVIYIGTNFSIELESGYEISVNQSNIWRQK